MVAFEVFQTVPVVALRDMSPYLRVENNGQTFPTPGEEFHFIRLDLSRALIKNPATTFFVQVTNPAMSGAGLNAGDILVVDRGLEPRPRSVIVALLEGEFVVRRLEIREDGLSLLAENSQFPAIDIEPDMEFSIWGIVRDVLRPQDTGAD